MGIGKRIKEARNKKNLTQTELADLIGVTKGAIANYENEISHPKESIMYDLINALDVDANFLFQDCVRIKKNPPESHETDSRDVSKMLENLLIQLGYMKPDKDISNQDKEFLIHLAGLLVAWFQKDS